MSPQILGLLAIPLEDTTPRRGWTRGRRAGILYQDAALPWPTPRFLDLDTLNPEPLDAESIAAGRMWILDQRHAGILATGIEKRRRSLRGQHVVFSNALSEKISLALRGLAASRPQPAAHASTAKAEASARKAAR